MLPVRIEGATRILGAPAGWNPQSNGPCCGLAIKDEVVDAMPYMTSAWEPTPSDLQALTAGGRVMLRILGTGHPPVAMWIQPLASAEQ